MTIAGLQCEEQRITEEILDKYITHYIQGKRKKKGKVQKAVKVGPEDLFSKCRVESLLEDMGKKRKVKVKLHFPTFLCSDLAMI